MTREKTPAFSALRQAFRHRQWLDRKDDGIDHRRIEAWNGHQSAESDFHQSGNCLGPGRDHSSASGFQPYPIIGHKSGKKAILPRIFQQEAGQLRLPRPTRPHDQIASPTQHDTGCMQVEPALVHGDGSAGRVRMKRAPSIRAVSGSRMFSARNDPPCASAICRLMERPRPEFWPKLSPSGRSV